MRTGCNFAGKPLRQSEHIGHFREKTTSDTSRRKEVPTWLLRERLKHTSVVFVENITFTVSILQQ